jgi:hypothetical protein
VGKHQTQKVGAKDFSLLKEYPLQDSLLAVTRVWDAGPAQELVVATKGAPETIFRLCAMKRGGGKQMEALQKWRCGGFGVLGWLAPSRERGLS